MSLLETNKVYIFNLIRSIVSLPNVPILTQVVGFPFYFSDHRFRTVAGFRFHFALLLMTLL